MFKLIFTGLLLLAQSGGNFEPDPSIACKLCDQWNQKQEPFHVFGNTYYVGVRGLSSVVIVTDDGLILIDGALPQSAAMIDRNIRALGLKTDDIRLILSSHAHFDHAGGIAALQRASGATVATSPAGAEALRRGSATADDPQYAWADSDGFPAVPSTRVVQDGETVTLGAQEITAHHTPGHTPGGTTWTWRSCDETRCLDVVYADSLTAVSAPGFRFTGDDTHPSIVPTFRQSIADFEQLSCDILIAAHPEFSNLFEKLERRNQGLENAFVDTEGCRAYANNATRMLDARIAEEHGAERKR